MKVAALLGLAAALASGSVLAADPAPAESKAMDHAHMAQMSHAPAAPAQAFSDLDKDKDGKLSRNEVPKTLAPHFGMLDTDSDGVLSSKEFSASQNM